MAELAGISRQIAANRMPAPLSNRAAHGSEYIDESPVKSPTALFNTVAANNNKNRPLLTMYSGVMVADAPCSRSVDLRAS